MSQTVKARTNVDTPVIIITFPFNHTQETWTQVHKALRLVSQMKHTKYAFVGDDSTRDLNQLSSTFGPMKGSGVHHCIETCRLNAAKSYFSQNEVKCF
jgi:hypothetical protein